MQSKSIFSSLLCLTLLNCALFAENNATSKADEPNLADGGGHLSTIKTYELGAVEITAPQELDFNPTVSVVSSNEIQKTASQDVAQALRFTPGVFYMPTTSYPSTIYIRGFSEGETGFYYDGIPISDIYAGNSSGETDLMPFTSFSVSEIQISKGYTSPTFSASKMGGAVNIVSSIPVKDLEFKANHTFITNNEHRTNLQVGRNFGSDYFQLSFSRFERKSLHYSYDYAGGPSSISNTKYESYMLTGKYGWLINDAHEYSINFYHQHAKRGDIYANWGYPNYDKTAFYMLGNSQFNKFLSLNSKVFYHMNMNKMNHSSANFAGIYDDYSVGLTETVQFDFSDRQNLKIGIMSKNDNHNARTTTGNNMQRDWSVINSSAFAEYALKANNVFRFVLSGSYDRHDGLKIVRGSSSAYVRDTQSNKHIQGYTLQGILYAQLNNATMLYANIGHKTNLPKIRALYTSSYSDEAVIGNDDLRAESLINYEVGADFNYHSANFGTSSLGGSVFYNDINDKITTIRVDKSLCSTPAGTGANTYCYQYQNVDNGYSYGGEVFVKQGFFADKFVLGANYAYVQRKVYNRDNYGNRTYVSEFTTHPRQNINFSALIAPRKEYDVNFMGSVQTSRYAYMYLRDANNNIIGEDYVKIPTVVYFDMVANYYLKENLKLSLGAYNLFDRNYNYSNSSTTASRGGLPGRRVFSSIEYIY